jgi:hypothetical protein
MRKEIREYVVNNFSWNTIIKALEATLTKKSVIENSYIQEKIKMCLISL